MILGTWEKNNNFFVFWNFHFFAFYRHFFDFFPYIILVNFLFQATGHSFSPRNVKFGSREPYTIRNWRLLNLFENSIFTVKGVIFSDLFWLFFNITLTARCSSAVVLVYLFLGGGICDLTSWFDVFTFREGKAPWYGLTRGPALSSCLERIPFNPYFIWLWRLLTQQQTIPCRQDSILKKGPYCGSQ